MLSFVSHFALSGMVVTAIVLFHILSVRTAFGLFRKRRGIIMRRWWGVAGICLLLLDLPLAYTLLFYKDWHPLIADQTILVIRYPWLLLQFNAAIVGILVLGYRHVYMRFIRHIRPTAVEADDNGSVSPGEIESDSGQNAGPAPLILTPFDQTTNMMSLRNDMTNESELTRKPGSSDESDRRRFLKTAAFATGGLILNGAVLSAANDDRDDIIERRTIRIPNLPDALKGTTIAMLSDVHSSVFMSRSRMERYARMLNGLKADVIVIPGDFVNSKVREVYPFGEAFSGLSAPMGVYGVTGNHDYYSGDIEKIASEVEGAGIRLLRNENVRLEKNGVSFRLLGMDDDAIYDVRQYVENGVTEKGRVENVMRGIAADEPTILLSHKPYPFEEYGAMGIDLTLSGHTHGGQIVLARVDRMNVSFASLASTYISGLYKAHSNPASQMYISRGIGTAGIPIRWNCPPEVTHITLV